MREPNQFAERLGGVDSPFAPACDATTAVSVHDISAGSRQAASSLTFTAFYDAHASRIAHALRMTLGDRELAEDAANEAMARALQRWKRVSAYENPEGWVYRVGLNWARSWLRRRRRERERPLALDTAAAELSIKDDELHRAVEQLSFDHRAVVVCRFFLDWSVEQTARSLDVPTGTVKSRLSRALDQIRMHMEEDR